MFKGSLWETDKALRNNVLYLKTYNNPCDWFNTAYNRESWEALFANVIQTFWNISRPPLGTTKSSITTVSGKLHSYRKTGQFSRQHKIYGWKVMLNVTLTRENSSFRLEKSLEFWYNQLTSQAKRKLHVLYKYDFLFGFDPTPPGSVDQKVKVAFKGWLAEILLCVFYHLYQSITSLQIRSQDYITNLWIKYSTCRYKETEIQL